MRSILLALALLLIGSSAAAQSLEGLFQPFNTWWVHPTNGLRGITQDSTFVNVDRTWDSVPDSSFSIDQVEAEARGNLRLSPSQEYMVGWGGTCGTGGSGQNFYVWSIPPEPGTVLTEIVGGVCIDRVAGSPAPLFYDTGLCQNLQGGILCNDTILGVSTKRVLYILTNSAASDEFELVWIDFATGTVAMPNSPPFLKDAEFVHVSPSGTQAFVAHDGNALTDYTLVDLCPGSLGTAFNQGGAELRDRSDILSARTTSVSGGEVIITVFGPTPRRVSAGNTGRPGQS